MNKSDYVPTLPFLAASSSRYPKSPASYHQTYATVLPVAARLYYPMTQGTGGRRELYYV